MKTIKRLKNNCVSKIYVRENASNFVLSPSLKIMLFSMFGRFTFEQLQWIIPVTEKSLSEQCEGGLNCCATGKPIYIYISIYIALVVFAFVFFRLKCH